MVIFFNIYIVSVFTEKPYIKPLERYVVYISISEGGRVLRWCWVNFQSYVIG